MTIGEVKRFYMDKECVPCPLTEKLVKAGFQQISGGYIDRAKKENLLVDYSSNSPSQYWHLMSFCNNRDENRLFSKSIVCGELIFWMAEVSNSVSTEELTAMMNKIINSRDSNTTERPSFDRILWNKEIQN